MAPISRNISAAAISSGCIRLTNEDAIDLYNRVKIGTPVVAYPPGVSLIN
jgi:lipoprotein-anchoring transpeptidase ErfK/SrfK